MNYQQTEKLKLTTPICKFKYSWLVEPDTKFDPPSYKVQALIPAAEGQALAEQLDEFFEQYKKQLKAADPNKKYKLSGPSYEFTDVDGEAVLQLRLKRKASGIGKDGRPYTSSVPLFDSQGKLIAHREPLSKMGAGTTGRVSFLASPYNNPSVGVGMSLKILSAQIIEFVPYGGGAESHGFAPVEGGWVPDEQGEQAVPFDGTQAVVDDSDYGDF
ncbi:MAG: hypothetical protein ACO29V_08850 [Limnohabitans sp.]